MFRGGYLAAVVSVCNITSGGGGSLRHGRGSVARKAMLWLPRRGAADERPAAGPERRRDARDPAGEQRRQQADPHGDRRRRQGDAAGGSAADGGADRDAACLDRQGRGVAGIATRRRLRPPAPRRIGRSARSRGPMFRPCATGHGRAIRSTISFWRSWTRKGSRLRRKLRAATLLRRVSLDLTGLPPSPEEVDEFLRDNRPDAYERVVDRLLASPHYGEKWARYWLDLARYADSDGYEKDRTRAVGMAVSRVGDSGVESRHAVRRVHHRATCRRPAAESHRGHAGGHRLQPQHADQSRRRHRSGAVPR